MISLATETDRTLFFDFLPIDLGTVRGFKTRIHLYTVPGQVFYEASRKLILKGADGVVFVADSPRRAPRCQSRNARTTCSEHMKEHEARFQYDPLRAAAQQARPPWNSSHPRIGAKQLQVKGEPIMEAVAVTGQGVFETLREVAKLVLAELRKNS